MSLSSTQDGHPIQKISLELLVPVFEQVQSPKDLLNCALCCKTWSTLAQNVLHRHVFLTDANISKFFNSDSWKNPRMKKMVQTFTLSIGFDLSNPHNVRQQHYMDTIHTVDRIPNRIAEMVNLRSFSCTTTLSPFFPVALLSSLPESCNSLEIAGEEIYESTLWETVPHICPYIHRLLPQLRHLRISWPALCTKIFEDGTSTASPASSIPDTALDLRTCIISTASPLFSESRLCRDHDDPVPDGPPRGTSPLLPLIRILRTELASGALGRAPEEILVISGGDTVGSRADHTSLVRHDVLAGRSVAMPSRLVGAIDGSTGQTGWKTWMIRTPDGEGGDVMASHRRALFGPVEKGIWREAKLVEGVRLDRDAMRRFGLVGLETVVGREEWERGGNRVARELCSGEGQVGMKLIRVEEGELEERPRVRERTPEGYRRIEGGRLVSIETEARRGTEVVGGSDVLMGEDTG